MGMLALLLIKTEPDLATHVATEVSKLNEDKETPDGLRVFGVHWTATVNMAESVDPVAEVIAGVRVLKPENLGYWIGRIKDEVRGVLPAQSENPAVQIVDQQFITRRGHNSGF